MRLAFRWPLAPGGAPAAATNSPKAQHVKEAKGDGFSTTVQPEGLRLPSVSDDKSNDANDLIVVISNGNKVI